jgi:starch phosphorylase
MVFLEDYDMGMARYLVQGVDVWMNTPLRPNEASGTSGMKAGMNGVLNFSILDGWWPEGFNGSNGWAIGSPEAGVQATDQNQQDAAHLLDILENKIVPLYYNGWASGRMSEGWITRVKESIRTLTPRFCTQRMLKEYMQKLYLPALQAEEIPEVM